MAQDSMKDELRRRCEELGVSTSGGVYKPKSDAWVELAEASAPELQRRIREEERHRREHNLWVVAVIAALASTLSAAAAWLAILSK
jgi:hypothetical protein